MIKYIVNTSTGIAYTIDGKYTYHVEKYGVNSIFFLERWVSKEECTFIKEKSELQLAKVLFGRKNETNA